MALAPAHPRQNGSGEVTEVEVDVREAGKLWWVLLVSGLVSATIGVAVLAYPGPSLKVLGLFLGIELLIMGVLGIIRSVVARSDPGAGGLLLVGILGLVAGLLIVRNPGETIVLLAVAFAIYLVVAGAVSLGHALVQPGGRGVNLARGIVLVGAGSVILSWPDISLTTLAVLTGIALILQGAVEVGEAFLVRSVARAERAE